VTGAPSCVSSLWRVTRLERAIVDGMGRALCPTCSQGAAEALVASITLLVVVAVVAVAAYVSGRPARATRVRR
jgi:hypothetical protein